MATTRTFNSMLQEYLTDELLFEELVKRNWAMQNIAHKKDWKGGNLIVPFMGNGASSVSFGSLTGSTDIAEANPVRGYLSSQPEAWFSLILNQRDLQEHDGKMPESTFLNIMRDVVDRGMDYFSEQLSFQMLGGPSFAAVTDATDAATGVMIVDRIERFCIGQKVSLDDDDSSAGSYYVTAVNMNTSAVTLSATRGGVAADVSAYSVAQNAKFYHPGGETSTFTSIKNALLSSTNGGGSTLHNVTKTSYPHTQAINASGAAITASNIVEKLFDFYVDVRRKGRGRADKFLMSFKNWGRCMKSQQLEKGAFKVVGEPKHSNYGWHEMTIASTVNGETLNIVACQEHDDDTIEALDLSSMKIHSNGGVVKHKSPDGNIFYVVRNTTGYQYIIDIVFRGDLAHYKPTNNGILHSISY